MTADVIRVLASVRLLPTAEGGRSVPARGSSRPNHNFLDADDRQMTGGSIDIPVGEELGPGETMTLPIDFRNWPGLDEQIYVGREWRIQEGNKLVGIGTVIALLSLNDAASSGTV